MQGSPPRQRPTRRQIEVLRSYIATGSITAAAHGLEIAESTVRQHLSGLYRRTGWVNAAQAAYALGVADTVEGSKGRQTSAVSRANVVKSMAAPPTSRGTSSVSPAARPAAPRCRCRG